MIRDDLSDKLIHLTRDTDIKKGYESFLNIIKTKTLIGGSTDVKGPFKCICFTEAPITSLAQVIARQTNEMRYSPYGFMFSKEYLFSLGARPVIYEPDEEYEELPDKVKYRHVRFDLTNDKKVDWTWEREWRLKIDEFKISPKDLTLIVPTRKEINELIAKYQENKRSAGYTRAFGSFPQIEWHFIALEDLGFTFE